MSVPVEVAVGMVPGALSVEVEAGCGGVEKRDGPVDVDATVGPQRRRKRDGLAGRVRGVSHSMPSGMRTGADSAVGVFGSAIGCCIDLLSDSIS